MSQASPVPLVTNEIVHALRAILGKNEKARDSALPYLSFFCNTAFP